MSLEAVRGPGCARAAVAIEIRLAKSEAVERRKREEEAQEARRIEIKRANEEYRARGQQAGC